MSRIRTQSAPTPPTLGLICGGLLVGLTAGWLAAELTGGPTKRRLKRLITAAPTAANHPGRLRKALDAVRAVLASDDTLADLDLQPGSAAAGRIELRGWVPNRRLRTRAIRLARTATDLEIVDHLRVVGEDDPPKMADAASLEGATL